MAMAMAIPLAIQGLSMLFGAKKKKAPEQTSTSAAMDALLGKQTQQMEQESPLRKMLLSQSAGLLPTYMKQDPQYAQWMQNSAPQAQAAMTAAATGGGMTEKPEAGRPLWQKALMPLGTGAAVGYGLGKILER